MDQKRTYKPKQSGASLNAVLFVLNVAALTTLTTLASVGMFKGEKGPAGAIGLPGYGSNMSESFAVAYTGGMLLDVVDVPELVVNWTDVVDTGAYPEYSPRGLFRALTYGSFSLTSGTFTVGVNGTYRASFQQYAQGNDGATYPQLLVNGVGNAMSPYGDSAVTTLLLRLVVGDVLQMTLTSSGAPFNVVPPNFASFNPPYSNTYALVWAMERTG